MSRITVEGVGAVTAAGWGVERLVEALENVAELPVSELRRNGGSGEVVSQVRRVPEPSDKPAFPKAARLRRASPVGRFAAAAGVEAIGSERLAAVQGGALRLGVVCTIMNGCVNYSSRFFGEVLRDPALASPILFPETVYNAPSSHLSALTCSTAPNDTLVGDGAEFFTGLDLAAEWLERGDCDGVLVVAPEELDWLSAEALGMYGRSLVASEGAGALYLERDGEGPQLLAVPDPVSFAEEGDRLSALQQVVERLGPLDDAGTFWVDGRCGVRRFDRPESEVLPAWKGRRFSPRRILGESMGAASGIQAAAAVALLRKGLGSRALVTAVGGNEQAAGCLFGR